MYPSKTPTTREGKYGIQSEYTFKISHMCSLHSPKMHRKYKICTYNRRTYSLMIHLIMKKIAHTDAIVKNYQLYPFILMPRETDNGHSSVQTDND